MSCFVNGAGGRALLERGEVVVVAAAAAVEEDPTNLLLVVEVEPRPVGSTRACHGSFLKIEKSFNTILSLSLEILRSG